MMEPIFHDGKKSCIGDQKLRDWTKWLFLPYFLAFLLIKRKKITKVNSLPT
jgi:hypothetical protein